MPIRFKDITNQEVIIDGNFLILIPGPLTTETDGKCRVVSPVGISIVPRDEAMRLREELFPSHKVN